MELFMLFLLSTIILLCFIEYLFFYTPNGKAFNKVPGPYKIPIFGNLFNLLVAPVDMFYKLRHFANKYKKIYSLQLCFYRVVNIFNPEDLEIILSNSKHNTKSIMYDFLHPWLQQGLLTSKGEKWHQRRKILTPAFHFNILRQFCKTFDEQSQNLISNIKSQNSQIIDVVDVITKCTINAMCETAMGTHMKTDGKSFQKYKNAIYKIGHVALERSLKIWLHSDIVFRMSSVYRKQKEILPLLHNFTTSVIRQRRNERGSGEGVQIIHKEDIENDVYMNGSKRRLAMLDLLLSAEAEGKIDEMGIREEVDTFMFEGHDTTTQGICFCLLMLAGRKDAQDKITQELKEIFEDSDRAAAMEDLNNMKYLEMCIKESLRMYPSVPFISRHMSESAQLNNYLVPAGSICHIHIYDLHRDPSIYPSPEDFIPERFTPENCAKRHPFAYIPFSAGPRNCIGQKFAMLELKSVISRILRNFILEPVTNPRDIVFTADLVLRSNDPMFVKFIPRTQNGNIMK